jgi:hypothetical protein
MKRCAFLLLLAGCVVPLASAQDREHIQLEVFADYFRLAQTDNNFGGVGALASFQAFEELKLEAQMSYDFNQTFTEGFTDTGTVTFFTHESAHSPRRIWTKNEHRPPRHPTLRHTQRWLRRFPYRWRSRHSRDFFQ